MTASFAQSFRPRRAAALWERPDQKLSLLRVAQKTVKEHVLSFFGRKTLHGVAQSIGVAVVIHGSCYALWLPPDLLREAGREEIVVETPV